MDRLAVMRSLVAAAQAESFSAAARRLGVSSSHVARQIASLERDLGVQLVNRNTRSLTLTDEGRRYLAFSKRVLRTLDEQDSAVREFNQRPEGDLAVLSPKWIGSLDLADAIAAFAKRNPRITVRFDTGPGGRADRMYSFVEEGYDVAFHTRPMRDSAVRFRQVAALPFALCASPPYLREHGIPLSAKDLQRHDCVMHRTDPIWHLIDDGRALRHKVLRPAFSTNTYLVAQKAAVAGLGLAVLPLTPIRPELETGRLTVIDALEVPARPLYAVYPPGLQSVQKLRVFLEFIASWFSGTQSAPLPCIEGGAAVGNIATDGR
jgi:DNA-binding transcriptional LysR family regulator